MGEKDTRFEIMEEDFQEFLPKAALICFEPAGGRNMAPFLELRPIRRDGSMGAASPVSRKFVQDMLAGFSEEYRNTPHGRIPSNLIYCDPRAGKETYIWYNPPAKRTRFFSERLNLENGIYHVPGTIYAVKEKTLRVFCFRGKKPKHDDILLGVPYFNIYRDGKVCMGTARPNIKTDPTYEDIMYAWENAFWNSIDVHTNGSPSTMGNLTETIRKYKDRPFDTEELEERQDRLTLNTLINELTWK